MADSPVDRLIDTVDFRCTVCAAPMGTCDCWTACECGHFFLTGSQCRNPVHNGGSDGR